MKQLGTIQYLKLKVKVKKNFGVLIDFFIYF